MKVKIKGLSNAELLSRIVDGRCLATGHEDTFVPQAVWVAERLEGQKWLAEEIIRCKDCKHSREIEVGRSLWCDLIMGLEMQKHPNADGFVAPDWFCAEGERAT